MSDSNVQVLGPARGFGAKDLELAHRERLRAQLKEVKPELFARGVEVMRAKNAADKALENLRAELHRTLGSAGVVEILTMLREQAEASKALEPSKVDGVPVPGHTIDAVKATHQPKAVSGRPQ